MVIANAIAEQVADAVEAFATVLFVSKNERPTQLQALLDHDDFGGNKAALGRALGYKNGAFIRQMIDGDRPITEKTIDLICGLKGGRYRHIFGAQSASLAGAAGVSPSLEQALEVLGIALARSLADDVRDDVADALAKLARRRGQERDQRQVLALLSSPTEKQQRPSA